MIGIEREPERRADRLADDRDTDAWARGLESLAGLPNVTCKLSGLVTEAGSSWRGDGLVEYHRRALGWFGPDRCMFGSDWPVCLLAAGYGEVLDLLMPALDDLDATERADVLGGTAADLRAAELMRSLRWS